MNGHFLARIAGFAMSGVLSVVSVPVLAQSSAAGDPNLSGFWINQYTPDLARALGSQPPFSAYGAERWKTVDTAKDPTGRCLPPGPSRAFTAPFPVQIVQTPEIIALLFEYQTIYRIVYMDGRDHPKDIADYPEFMGHSVGKWEGDTLVVDTVGLNETTWLDDTGHPHSDALHIVERFRRTDFGHMELQVTIDDPKAYKKPWTARIGWELMVDTELLDWVCENEKDFARMKGN